MPEITIDGFALWVACGIGLLVFLTGFACGRDFERENQRREGHEDDEAQEEK